ncbi:uncharacterized protein [Haliotis asinina]|uniref:uncharacterized protein n=1 Tax=Haliotis asinina TaxID=109174 RepID=UPI0035321F7B
MEPETNNALPFLDVIVTRLPTNTLQTTVYRKPTHINQYVNYHSNHPPQVKTGIISTLSRRAKNICSTNLQEELNHLKDAFTGLNDYPPELVNRTIASTLSATSTPPRTRTEPAPITISIPYTGKISHQISRLMKQHASIVTTFSTPQTLNNLLQANGRTHSKSRKSIHTGVVYKSDCNCGQSYIGETSRPINARVKEHQASTNKSDNKSAVSEHIQSSPNHQINWTEYTLLSTNQPDFTKRKLTIHITTTPTPDQQRSRLLHPVSI